MGWTSEKTLVIASFLVLSVTVGLGVLAVHRANAIDVNRTSELVFSASRTMNDFDRLRFTAKQAELGDPKMADNALEQAFAMSRSRMANLQSGEFRVIDDPRLRRPVQRVIEIFEEMQDVMSDPLCNVHCQGERLLPKIRLIKREIAKLQGRGLTSDARMRDELRSAYQQTIIKLFVLAAIIVMFSMSLITYVLFKNRALKLQAENLQKSRRRIQEISEYRAQFLAGMSHEFRTPINAIKGFSQFILFQGPKISREKIYEYLRDIEGSASDLEALTNRVLDLAKIDSGTFELDESDVDFAAVLDEVVRQFAVVHELLPARIVLLRPDRLSLTCDSNALKRCLQNLISNALKFSETTTQVMVEVAQSPDALSLSVSDRGCGIPASELGAVWGDYVRSSYTRHSDKQGTGLGLPIVKALVTAHGGTVELESGEGIGTTVTIKLPAARVLDIGSVEKRVA